VVRRTMWQWHPLDPLLVSVPGSERLLPPVCIPSLAVNLQKRMLLQYRALLMLILCVCVMLLGAFWTLQDPFFLRIGLVVLLLFSFVLAQYSLVFRRLDSLRAYSRFFAWCYLQPKKPVVLTVSAMVAIGCLQAFLQSNFGGLTSLIQAYGLVFEVALAEPWRYLTGPLLHGGPAHWFTNLALLLVGSGLAFAIGRPWAVGAVFATGALLPGIALTFLPHWIGLDAYLGISGGLFALLGWVAGASARYRRTFPAHVWWVVLCLTVLIAIVSSVVDPRASWFSHGLGLLIGLAIGASGRGLSIDLADDRAPSSNSPRP